MTDAEVPDLDLSLKKKKKKSTKKVEEAAEEVENVEVADKKGDQQVEEEAAPSEEGGDPESIDFGKKKKKKGKKTSDSAPAEKEGEEEEDGGDVHIDDEESDVPVSFVNEEGQEVLPWAGSDRDYSYEELAGRIYSILHSHNPDFGNKTKRYVMKPPEVAREGTKKTVWVNFAGICNSLKRKPDHVLNYVLAELGSNGSVDGSHRLVIKNRFQQKQIENVIRHYIGEYVVCRTCKSPDTTLKKENRLYFLCCDSCGSTRSVVAIKKGFEAQVGKRKKDKQ